MYAHFYKSLADRQEAASPCHYMKVQLKGYLVQVYASFPMYAHFSSPSLTGWDAATKVPHRHDAISNKKDINEPIL